MEIENSKRFHAKWVGQSSCQCKIKGGAHWVCAPSPQGSPV